MGLNPQSRRARIIVVWVFSTTTRSWSSISTLIEIHALHIDSRVRQARTGIETTGFSLLDVAAITRASTTLDAVVEYHNMYFILLGGEEPARVATGVVSWDYFDTLGIVPALGRTFTAADDRPHATSTLILSHEYWQRAFGGDPAVIGAIGMLAGFCGTLMTPMAANFNLVPAALLELKDQYGVIRAQVATALPLLLVNIMLIYWLAFR